MKKLILTFCLLIMVVWPVSVNAAENQSIIFGGSYSLDNEATDADSAWLYMFYYASLVGSTIVTAEDLQWNGCYQYAHNCTNDSTNGWTGWWVYFDESETVSINEWGTVATARDSSYALETSVTAIRDSMDEAAQIADTTGTAESVADQVWREDLSGHNIYGGAAVSILANASIQALALAPGSHEQTTTRIALNLTATTNDLFNGCLLNSRSGVNEGFTTRITDYEAYSGDSGVVIVSPPLVLAATENQLFVITLADHAEGDTNQLQVLAAGDLDSLEGAITDANKENFKTDVSGLSTLTDNELRIALGDSLYNERMDSLLTLLVNVKGRTLDLVYYWGACNGCYYRLFPEGGVTNKDSVIIIDPSLGADSLVGKIIYLHGTEPTVYDSAYFYRDEPW